MPINLEIVSYIRKQLALGVPRINIVENLKKVGWSNEVIMESFDAISLGTPISEIQPEVMQSPEPDSVNSPYSSLLAVVLVISLFILTNGIFSDIKSMTATENQILLFEGLFVIPFLLVAFLLHSSFGNDKARFKILSFPYFIISAWILLRLLWKVGQNIWEAKNALGVYIVLGMVVVVLTGIIIFIQHYIKK